MRGLSFRVRGSYFESCNCDAICPCRMVDGVPGGRSTHGTCFGVLSWRIDEGRFEDVDLGGLSVALVYAYDDDEPGSPWRLILHVDAEAGEREREALEHVFLDGIPQLPWIRKARHLITVRSSAIEIDGTHVRIGSGIAVHASRPVETDAAVACGVPGYDRLGHELYADELRVDDGPFSWALSGTCAYASDFDYAARAA